MEHKPTLVFTKPTPWTDEDRKTLAILSRVNSQGAAAPPFVVKHMMMHGIAISQTTQITN